MLFYLAKRNLFRRLRFLLTAAVCVFAAAFAAVLAWSVLDAARAGLALSRERQGADIVVYPNETEVSDASMLYSGIAQSVYMDQEILRKLDTAGAAAVTGQFYLQTLPAADCCSVGKEYRLVGIDWDSDFVVRPWIKDRKLHSLKDGQVIVGSGIADEVGAGMVLLNHPVRVVSVLEPTGTALDQCIILNMEQLQKMAETGFPPDFFRGSRPAGLVTCALVRLRPGVSPKDYIASLRSVDAKVVSTASVRKTLEGEIGALSKILTGLLAVMLLLCCAALSSQFRMLTLSRCREVGYLRSIGMSRLRVYAMFLVEFGLVSFLGGAAGSAAGMAAAFPAADYLRRSLSIPLEPWSAASCVLRVLIGTALALAVCGAATVLPLRRIARISPHDAIAKGEM
ncbi:MAG: ABC transporter permease [Oscillibacter sp.]|jgi:putative ABC transport system permease protein|nr:ABC transporter permease [Oscillibacter sp.]